MGIFYWCPNTSNQRVCGPRITLLVNAIICLILSGMALWWWFDWDGGNTEVVYLMFYYGYLVMIILFFVIKINIFIVIAVPPENRTHEVAAFIFTLMAFINIIVILVSFICMIIYCATVDDTKKFIWATVGAGLLTWCSFFLFLDLNSYYEDLSE